MKCQYCGKESGNVKQHEKFCKSRPLLQKISSNHEDIDALLHRSEKLKEYKEPAWKKIMFWLKIFQKKPTTEKKEVTVEEMLTKLPNWAIKESKPWFVGENKKRKLIQFVGISRLKPPVMAWVFWDGIFVSVEDRIYQPPHDIRGNVFFYDLDNSRPLLDNIQEDEETHESLRMAQVKNIAYAMGRIAGAQDLLKNLGLILLGIGFIVLLSIGNLYLSYQTVQGFGAANAQIGNITTAVQNYMVRHP